MEMILLRHGKACPVCRYVHHICPSFPCLMHLATPVFLSTSMHYSASRYRRKIRIRLCHPRRSFIKATPSRNRAERSSITPLVLVCLLKSTRWNCVVAMGRRSIRGRKKYRVLGLGGFSAQCALFRLTRIRTIDDSTYEIVIEHALARNGICWFIIRLYPTRS